MRVENIKEKKSQEMPEPQVTLLEAQDTDETIA